MKINPRNTWRLVEERLAIETDPRLRCNLHTVDFQLSERWWVNLLTIRVNTIG
ncbi:MAG TPA: hypothetical protein VGH29_19840 [Candidatus Binataceae bacterium]